MKTLLSLCALAGSLFVNTVQALSCGDVLFASTTLTSDLTNCPFDGLYVLADDVTIDLNGHTIDGMGSGNGIVLLPGKRNLTVTGAGTISEFDTGILLEQGKGHLVEYVRFRDNRIGISATDVSVSEFSFNDMRDGWTGVMLLDRGSKYNRVADNYVSGMIEDGIWLFDSHGNEVENNSLTDNSIGVRLSSSSENAIRNNTFSGNFTIALKMVSSSGGTVGTAYNRVSDNRFYNNDLAVFLGSMIPFKPAVKNYFGNNQFHSGNRAVWILDADVIKTVLEDNLFVLNSGYDILDGGTSTQTLGNTCDGLACP